MKFPAKFDLKYNSLKTYCSKFVYWLTNGILFFFTQTFKKELNVMNTIKMYIDIPSYVRLILREFHYLILVEME